MPHLVLASTSRYRRELLERLRLPFDVARPQVDETALPGETPHALAIRLALAKALAIAGQHSGDVWALGSDQVADVDGHALGKPGGREAAIAQLRATGWEFVPVGQAAASAVDDAALGSPACRGGTSAEEEPAGQPLRVLAALRAASRRSRRVPPAGAAPSRNHEPYTHHFRYLSGFVSEIPVTATTMPGSASFNASNFEPE